MTYVCLWKGAFPKKLSDNLLDTQGDLGVAVLRKCRSCTCYITLDWGESPNKRVTQNIYCLWRQYSRPLL